MRMDSIATGTELICADCGRRFRARRVTDGVEEICDACYQARLPADSTEPGLPARHSRHPLAAD